MLVPNELSDLAYLASKRYVGCLKVYRSEWCVKLGFAMAQLLLVSVGAANENLRF